MKLPPHVPFLRNQALLVSKAVRDAMEDLHADPDNGLTDPVMAQLNPIVRNAVYSTLHALAFANEKDELGAKVFLRYLDKSIPDYWEQPSSWRTTSTHGTSTPNDLSG